MKVGPSQKIASKYLPQWLISRWSLVHGDLLPGVRLERPLLDDVVADLGAAVRLRGGPLQLDALLVVVGDFRLSGFAGFVWEKYGTVRFGKVYSYEAKVTLMEAKCSRSTKITMPYITS